MKALPLLALTLLTLATTGAMLPAAPSIHYYDNPAVSLQNVKVDLVYFVPQELSDEIFPAWKASLEDGAALLKEFYEMQFGGRVAISVQSFPRPVIGTQETSFYNNGNTDGGNPEALLKIREELVKRLYASGGDLFRKDFAEDKDAFRVTGIIYEGVGASGSGAKQTFLIAREYLTREPIRSTYGFSFLAHEFGHTLGMPDLSIGEHNDGSVQVIFTNDDLMGAGRYKPLTLTYLSEEIKKHM